MGEQGQRTEKPTKRKIEKSRREGQFPASRELLAALQFLTFVILLLTGGGAFFERDARNGALLSGCRLSSPAHAARGGPDLSRIARARFHAAALDGGHAHGRGAGRCNSASTRLGLSFHNLAPDPKRMNPLQKLRNVPRQNAASFLQALAFSAFASAGGLQNRGRKSGRLRGSGTHQSAAGAAMVSGSLRRFSVEGGAVVSARSASWTSCA